MEQIGSNPFLKQDIVSQVEPASAVESWSKVKEILLETPDKAKAISELIEFARQQSNTDLKIGALVKAEISASALSMPGEDLTRLNCLYDIFLELSKIHGQRENALEKAKIKLRTTFGQPGQEHQAFITFQNELGNSSECAENTNKQIFTPEEEKALSAYNQFNLLVRKLDPFDQLCCASLFFPKTDQEKEQIEKWIEVNILDCMASRAKILRKSEKLPAFLILNLLLKGQEQILEHRSFEDPRFIKKIDNLLNQKRKAHANLIALSPVWNQKLADSIFVDLYVNPDKFESPIKSDEHEGKSSVMIVLRKDGDFFSIGERLQNCWEPEPTKGHKKSKLLVGNFWVLTHYFVDKDTTAIASIDKESDRLAMIFIVKKALVNGQQAFVIEDFDFTSFFKSDPHTDANVLPSNKSSRNQAIFNDLVDTIKSANDGETTIYTITEVDSNGDKTFSEAHLKDCEYSTNRQANLGDYMKNQFNQDEFDLCYVAFGQRQRKGKVKLVKLN